MVENFSDTFPGSFAVSRSRSQEREVPHREVSGGGTGNSRSTIARKIAGVEGEIGQEASKNDGNVLRGRVYMGRHVRVKRIARAQSNRGSRSRQLSRSAELKKKIKKQKSKKRVGRIARDLDRRSRAVVIFAAFSISSNESASSSPTMARGGILHFTRAIGRLSPAAVVNCTRVSDFLSRGLSRRPLWGKNDRIRILR